MAAGTRARLVRSLAGTGGYLLLVQLGDVPGGPPVLAVVSMLGFAFGVVSFVGLFTTAGPCWLIRRGVSYRFARLRMADARMPLGQREPAEPVR